MFALVVNWAIVHVSNTELQSRPDEDHRRRRVSLRQPDVNDITVVYYTLSDMLMGT